MTSVELRKALGEWLRAYRHEKGLSVWKLAKNGKIAISQVKAVESGDTNYTINILLGYLSGCNLCVKFHEKV